MVMCELCDSESPRPAVGRCVSCDASVCASHRWSMLGLCHECASKEEVRAQRESMRPRPAREVLDIKWLD